MAFEYGSHDLGIRNPFRFEGTIRAIRGVLTSLIGLLLLLKVADAVTEHAVLGWFTIALGFIVLANGLWALGSGLMQTLRFFVGRSVPTSLAPNHAPSEADSARAEKADVAYDASQLEQMLVGRKNITFTEPTGLIARLIHTLFPKLTFVPYPIRNMAQQLADTIAQTLLAIVAYGLTSFVLMTGLVGDNTRFISPLISTLFMLYLMFIWFRAGSPISRNVSRAIQSRSAAGIARTLVLAVTFPLTTNYLVNAFINSYSDRHRPELLKPLEEISHTGNLTVYHLVDSVHAGVSNISWMLVIALLGAFSFALLATLISKRCAQANPVTEVSELRDNWQEPVHPREIFINLDSMVMANRRYKEVPNRVYSQLKPMLKEQSNGKGAFYGETIQETQPSVKAVDTAPLVKKLRIIGTVVGQLLMFSCAAVVFFEYFAVVELSAIFIEPSTITTLEQADRFEFAKQYGAQLGSVINGLLAILVFGLFGRLLTNLTHVMWSEVQFESQLIYFKCEGTYTESTLSTGKGIYDSTQSENVIVRSSMTPWIVVSHSVSSVFAGVGSKNLEQPRHLMELHSNDKEMDAIVADLRSYLSSRQTIASLNTEADLAATAQINEINEQSRAIPMQQMQQEQQIQQVQQPQPEMGGIAASYDNQLESPNR